MTFFLISIPFMLVAVGIAVVPLLAMSRSERRQIALDFERRREQHRLAHQHDRRPHGADSTKTGTAHVGASRSGGSRRHEPVLVRRA